MEESFYRITITGINSDHSPQEVIDNLGRLFKTDPFKFQSLAKGNQITLSNKLNREKANLYKSSLERIGCTVLVELLPKQPNIHVEKQIEKQTTSKPAQQNVKCPSCDYVRKATETQSENECPKCGVIYSKYKKTEPINRVKQQEKISMKSNDKCNKKFRYIFVPVFIVIVSIAVYLLMSKKEDPPTQVVHQPVKTVINNHKIASKEKKSTDNILIIHPNETKSITVTSVFPIMHPSDCDFDFSTRYIINKNEWAEAGVTVTIDSTELSSFTKSVWEAQNVQGDWYIIGLPDTGPEKLRTTAMILNGGENNGFIKDLAKVYRVWNVKKFFKYQELSEEDFLNHSAVKWRKLDNIRKADYTFYQINIGLTIFSPDTSDVTRDIGIINITSTDFSLGVMHASTISHWGHLHLKRIVKRNGLKITMTNGWTIIQ